MSFQGPKLTFLGRRQLASEIFFFSRHMEKCGRQKVSIKFFLCSETQNKIFGCQMENSGHQCFFFRIRTIFLLMNEIKNKHTYHSKTMMNELNAGHIWSFVRPLTVSSHFCSLCKRIANKQRPFNV